MSIHSPNFTPLSPLSFLERSARVFPDRTAIIHGEQRWNYREFSETVLRMARALRTHIAIGDRVAFLSPNTPQMLFAHYAVPLAGGVLVALNPRLTSKELEHILDHSGAVMLFVDSEFSATTTGLTESVPTLSAVAEIKHSRPTADYTSETPSSFDVFLAAGDSSEEELTWGVDDENAVIAINYTSGTTGKPKGVMYTHRGAYLNALGETFHNGFTGNTKYLWTLPMFHCNGWCATWAVTQAAGTHVCLRAVRDDAIWDAIDNLAVTHLSGAPTVCSTIAQSPSAHPVGTLRITTAGAPPSPTVIGQLEALGIEVIHVYGLTEVYGPFTICEPQDHWSQLPSGRRAELLSRQGVNMVQADYVRVVDTTMVDVPADSQTMGEILLRGNTVMAGYYRDDEATAAAFSGGWFHTGDLGVMHPDGYIQVRDRAKDIVISGGENISTVEVEQALIAHPEVADVAVVGVPHPRWGERPKAFIVPIEGAAVTSESLTAHAHTMLARYKVPDEFVFLDSLPRNSTGKIVKHELRSTTTTP